MRFFTTLASVAALTLALITVAKAEDAPASEPVQSAAVKQIYVRGDLGMGWHDVGEFTQASLAKNTGFFESAKVEETVILGVGIGTQVNRHVRFDLTGEYRTRAHVEARDNITAKIIAPDGLLQSNTDYRGRLESIVGLVNGYVDLFTYQGITPYVGAGVGIARNTLTKLKTSGHATFTDAFGVVAPQTSNGFSESNSRTDLAWALMAGASLDLTKDVKLDIGYRYLDLGGAASAKSGLLICDCGTIGTPLKLQDLESHEFRIGVRIALWSDR